uniref:Uncharacterized protein n=1 Tax=Leersia perrieri TaxID=77586 RepID=A0A0D9WAU2_9ORYZ
MHRFTNTTSNINVHMWTCSTNVELVSSEPNYKEVKRKLQLEVATTNLLFVTVPRRASKRRGRSSSSQQAPPRASPRAAPSARTARRRAAPRCARPRAPRPRPCSFSPWRGPPPPRRPSAPPPAGSLPSPAPASRSRTRRRAAPRRGTPQCSARTPAR